MQRIPPPRALSWLGVLWAPLSPRAPAPVDIYLLASLSLPRPGRAAMQPPPESRRRPDGEAPLAAAMALYSLRAHTQRSARVYISVRLYRSRSAAPSPAYIVGAAPAAPKETRDRFEFKLPNTRLPARVKSDVPASRLFGAARAPFPLRLLRFSHPSSLVCELGCTVVQRIARTKAKTRRLT